MTLSSEIIKEKVQSGIHGATEVRVGFDGSKAHIIVVFDGFKDMRRIQKQQLVYGVLSEEIADGSIHAVTMETLTSEEWDQVKHFR